MYNRLFIFSFSVWGAIGCQSVSPVPQPTTYDKSALQLTPVQEEGAGIVIDTLREDSVWQEVRLVGRTVVLAHSRGKVHSRIEGTVEAILVREGQFVEEGQELFRLYSASLLELQKNYAESYQRWRSLSQRLTIQESLRVRQLSFPSEVIQLRSELQQQDAQLRALEAQLRLLGMHPDTTGQLRLLSVRAPLRGYITQVSVALGEYVRPEQALASILNTSDVHADLFIAERELEWMRPGMPVILRFPALAAAKEVITYIEYITQVEDTTGAYLVAHVRVPPMNIPIFSAFPVEGVVKRYLGRLYAVPRSAIAYHSGQNYLFLKRTDGTYYPLTVRVQSVDTLAILEGVALTKGLVYVKQGAAFLASQLWQVDKE
ncbi:MAG: efflux RND transporter periplasmic adaptor subunit [Bacteroidia bacterium]|nr:efflux RND transporter periplasmic adaptor subunit [Bacteroidia bacterium]MDW8235212.1 efflux RND transporter periplasmic adaptor subunit [Bacteroidia bacterium]